VRTNIHHHQPARPGRTLRIAACALAASATVALALMASGAAHAEEGRKTSLKAFGAGITVDSQPRVEESGLPLYPGATVDKRINKHRHREDDSESSDGVNLNLWFGSYGIKVVAIKLKSDDDLDHVKAFYQRALAEYGDVLDCSDDADSNDNRSRSERAADRRAKARAEKNSNVLTCDDSQLNKSSRRDGKFFKSGTKSRQYAVSIKPDGAGSSIQLLHFVKRGGEE
jgi:hypothetical protein